MVTLHEFDMTKYSIPLPTCYWLLLSDVIYSKDIAISAAHRVYEAVTKHNASVIVTDPGRIDASTFLNELKTLFSQNATLKARLEELYFKEMNIAYLDFKGYYLQL